MRVRTRPARDSLTRPWPEGPGNETLLLYDNEVVRLGPLGSAIVSHAVQPVTPRELAAALQAEFGAPAGDPLAATQTAVDDLISRRVLERLSTEDEDKT